MKNSLVTKDTLDEAITILKQVLKERDTEPVPGQAQEEAPAVLAGASKTPTWDHVLAKLYQLEARLAALERET